MGYRFIDVDGRPTRQQNADKVAALQKDPDPPEVCVDEPCPEPLSPADILNKRACVGWASEFIEEFGEMLEIEEQTAQVQALYGHPYILDDYNPALGGKCCPPKDQVVFESGKLTEPWMTPQQLFECCDTSLTWEQAERAIQYASELLYMCSGRQFRGIKREIHVPNCARACDTGCDCCAHPRLYIPGPIAGICEIVIDGQVLPTSSYMISHDQKSIARVDGKGWPQYNDTTRDPRKVIVTRRLWTPEPAEVLRVCRPDWAEDRDVRLAPDCPEWVEPFLRQIGYDPEVHVNPDDLSVGRCAQWAADYIASHPELLESCDSQPQWVVEWMQENGYKLDFGTCTKCCDSAGRSTTPAGATIVCCCDGKSFLPCQGSPANPNHCCSRDNCGEPQASNHCQIGSSCGCSKHMVKNVRASEVLYAVESCDGVMLQVPDPQGKPIADWAREYLDTECLDVESISPGYITLPTFAARKNVGGPRLLPWVQDWVDNNGYHDVTFGVCIKCEDEQGEEVNGAGAQYICCSHPCAPKDVKPCKGTQSNPNHCCFTGGCWQGASNHCQSGRCSCRAHGSCGSRSRLAFACDDGTGIKYATHPMPDPGCLPPDPNLEPRPLLTIDDPHAEPAEIADWAQEFLDAQNPGCGPGVEIEKPSNTKRITLPTYSSGNNGIWEWVEDYLDEGNVCGPRIVVGYCKECAEATTNLAGATVLVCNHNHRPSPCRNKSAKKGHCCFQEPANGCLWPEGYAHGERPANHCQHGGCGCTVCVDPVCPPRPAVLSSALDEGFGLLQVGDPHGDECLTGWASEYLVSNEIDIMPQTQDIVLPTFASSANCPTWAQDWADMTGECINYGKCPKCTNEDGLECDPVTGAFYICDCPPEPEPEPELCDIPEGCLPIVDCIIKGKKYKKMTQVVKRHCCTQVGSICCNPDHDGSSVHANCCQSGHSTCAPTVDPDEPCPDWPPTCTVTFLCPADCEELTTKGFKFPRAKCGGDRPEPKETWSPWMYEYFGYKNSGTPGVTSSLSKGKRYCKGGKPPKQDHWPDWLCEYFGYEPEARPFPKACKTFPDWVNQWLEPSDAPQICDDWVVEYLSNGDRCGNYYNVAVAEAEPEPVYVSRVLTDTTPDEKYLAQQAELEAERRAWSAAQRHPAWHVEYLRGCLPPGAGIPIQKLACQIAAALCGQDGCSIPFGVTELKREGVEIDMRQAWDAIHKGKTGIWEVDMWVNKINPMGLRERVTVHRADACRKPPRDYSCRNDRLHSVK